MTNSCVGAGLSRARRRNVALLGRAGYRATRYPNMAYPAPYGTLRGPGLRTAVFDVPRTRRAIVQGVSRAYKASNSSAMRTRE
jgi:hypothetical protein